MKTQIQEPQIIDLLARQLSNMFTLDEAERELLNASWGG